MENNLKLHKLDNSSKNYMKVKLKNECSNDLDSETYQFTKDNLETLFKKYFKLIYLVVKVLIVLLILVTVTLVSVIIFNISMANKDKCNNEELATQNVSTTHVVHHHYHHYESEKNNTVSSTAEAPKDDKEAKRVKHDYRFSKDDLPTELFIQQKNTLWNYNPKSQDTTAFYEIDGNSAFKDFLVHEDTVMWIERNSSKIRSASAKSGGNRSANVIYDYPGVTPRAMALDTYTGNLYVVLEGWHLLLVVDVATKESSFLRNSLHEPSRIALDSAEGKIFVLQGDNSIMRIEIPGSTGKIIETGAKILGMAIDTSAKKLYWIDDSVGITSSDYDGENRATVRRDYSMNRPVKGFLAVRGNILMVYEHEEFGGTVLTCKIHEGVCRYRSMGVLETYVKDVDSIQIRQE